MKIPKFEKRYKVVWEYYYSFGRKTQKTFENVTHAVALEWVKVLIDKPITNSLRVTDYEGNYKMFTNHGDETVARRVSFLEDARNAWGEDQYAKKLKAMGDVRDTPLAVQANFDYIRDKRDLTKYINLLTLGEATRGELYDVAGIPVSKVIARCAALERGMPEAVAPVPKLTERQVRLLKACKMYHKYLDVPCTKLDLEEV